MVNPPTTSVGANVRAELARRGVSQTALADHLGLSQSGVSKRLRGVIAFDTDEMLAMSDFLDVPVAVLFEGAA